MIKVKRLSEKEFIERALRLWNEWHDRPEMSGVSFEQFKEEALAEFRKQEKMSNEELLKYREKTFNEITSEANSLCSPKELEKFRETDRHSVNPLEESIKNNGGKK